MRPSSFAVRICGSRAFAGLALFALTGVILASCASPLPYGVNEPPDAVDKVRELDLEPRFPQPTPTADTGTGELKPQIYLGKSAGQVEAIAEPAPGSGNGNGEGVSLNFVDAPVSEVAKVILGDTLQLGYAVDPRVQGTVTLSSGRPVSKSHLLFVLEDALRMSNAVLVHDAGGYRIIPADDAVGAGHVERESAQRHETEPGYGISVVPLQHVSAQTIMKLLESFAAKPGSIRADPSKNLIIVAGNGVERKTAVDTILSFDEEWLRGQSVGIFPIHNTTPEPIVGELEKILDSGEDGLSQHLVKLQPISAANAVLVVARKPELLRAAGTWISRLDKSTVASTGVKVYKVRYGDCRQIAKLLGALFTGSPGALESPTNVLAPGAGATGFTAGFGGAGAGGAGALGAGGGLGGGGLGGGGLGGGVGGPGAAGGGLGGGSMGGGGAFGGSQAQSQGPFGTLTQTAGGGGAAAAPGAPTEGGPEAAAAAGGLGGGAGGGRALMPGVRILPDIVNNTIVIYANAEQYRVIEKALNQIDRPQPQVAVDMTIAEVNLTNDLSYGVQFFLGTLGTQFGSDIGVQASNTPSGAVPPTRQPGFNLIIGNRLTPRVVISALNQYTTTKILANPSLVVINNQVATLLVGQQVPVSTGNANILSAASVNSNTVFSSITYQNTGIILRIQPRIHANGEVNLDIDQEISQPTGTNACAGTAPAGTTAPCPTFTDRHVKSAVLVPDGQTVLLAGLIQETQAGTRNGIPFLDQIPVIGEALTPTNTRGVDRIELIIFIRPQIIRDSVDASYIAEELRSKMRGDKVGTLRPPGSVTPYPLGLVQ